MQNGGQVAFLSVKLDQRSAKFSCEGPGSQNLRLYGQKQHLAKTHDPLTPEPDTDDDPWEV